MSTFWLQNKQIKKCFSWTKKWYFKICYYLTITLKSIQLISITETWNRSSNFNVLTQIISEIINHKGFYLGAFILNLLTKTFK